MDMLGLYRAVIGLGGLQANESYDEGGRWTGNINFSGAVFPKMSNYTENNKATSIGNQLLSNYKKYLLPYEQAYAAVDITVNALTYTFYTFVTIAITPHPSPIQYVDTLTHTHTHSHTHTHTHTHALTDTLTHTHTYTQI
jgi:hypothetical protein